MPKKSKKATPPELDFIFQRELLAEKDYGEFWGRWGKANKREKERIVNEYLGEEAEETDDTISAPVTRNKKTAKFQAEVIGGRVARRNKRGQFSKRGTFYQAIRYRRKK